MFARVSCLTAMLAAGLAYGAGNAAAERAPALESAGPSAFEVTFQIRRNGTPIGEHRYSFTLDGASLTVDSSAVATVTLLGLPIYRFTQQVREVWHDGRLLAMDADTDDNGERTRVSARATGRGLIVEGPLGRALASATAVPTTYWNIGMVRGAQLIDTRDGEVMSRPVTPPAWERIAVSGGAIAAQRYRIIGRTACDVWYDAAGIWHRAACDTEHGRIEDVRMQVSGDREKFARMLSIYYGGDERVAQRVQ